MGNKSLLVGLTLLLKTAGKGASADEIFYGDNWDRTMAGIHGTCTRNTCPPGTRLKVDAVPGDFGIAETWDRDVVDLLKLKGMNFVVMSTDGHSSSAWLLATGGIAYCIQWMFLKKVAEENPTDWKTKSPGVVATGLAQSCAQHFQQERVSSQGVIKTIMIVGYSERSACEAANN